MAKVFVILENGSLKSITPSEAYELIPHPVIEPPDPDPDPEPDIIPPVVLSKSVTPSKSGAIIRVICSEPSEIDVKYGLTTAYELGKVSDTTPKLEHRIELTDLQSETEYHFLIRLEDVADNIGFSDDITFTTLDDVPDPVPGDHSLYETEKLKPGVVSYASYRTPPGVDWLEEQHVDGRSYDNVRGADAGDANYPVMDRDVDGLKIFVQNGVGDQQTQIRRIFEDLRIKGNVHCRYDIRPSAAFLNDWDGGFKLMRAEDSQNGVGDKRILTQNRSAGNGDFSQVYYRDGEGVWERESDGAGGSRRRSGSDKREVRIWYADDPPTIDNQPGGDTHVWRENRDPLGDGKPGFYFSPDTWHRFTEHYNFSEGKFECWVQKLEGSDTNIYKVIDFPIEHWKNSPQAGMDRFGFWGHSTSGVHGNGVTFWWYRNLIISREPIALQ